MAYIGRQLARGENKLFDDISSSFNGSTTVFNLTVSSVATSTATAFQLFVSLGGVMQKPNTDFTTAGNQITFTTAPAAGLSCWIMMQGDTIDQAAIPDASVTPSKIAGSGDFAFPADVRLKDGDGSHYVGFQSATTVSTSLVWTLPAADGSANQYLKTDGSGNLSWGSDANAPEGTAVLSTGESSTNKYLRTDGDGTCSWQTIDTSTYMLLTGGTFTGDVTFDGATAGRDIVFDRSDNALEFADDAKLKFGSELEIYSTGAASYIKDTGTGNLTFDVDNLIINNAADSATIAKFKEGDACELYFNNSLKFATNNTGVAITGAATISTNLTVTGDLTVSGTTTTINTQTLDVEDKNVVIGKVSSPSDTTADGGGWTLKGATDKTFNWVDSTDAWTSSEHIHVLDGKKLIAGTGSDIEIYHSGGTSYIDNSGGHLFIQNGGTNDNANVYIRAKDGEDSIVCQDDGQVEIFHDNSKVFETETQGIQVLAPDGYSAFLRLYADRGDDDADKYWLKTEQDGTGFYLQNNVSGSTETNLRAVGNGAVDLYHNNSKKLETTSGGINVTGAINVNGSALSSAPTITATASGSVAANKPVIVDGSGTVSTITGYTFGMSSRIEVLTSDAQDHNYSYQFAEDSNTNRIFGLYKTDSQGRQRYIVGTRSGSSITWGSSAEFTSSGSAAGPCNVIAVGSDKFFIVYNYGTDNHYYVRIATTTSSNTATFGTNQVLPDSSNNNMTVIDAPQLAYNSSNGHVLLAYGFSGIQGRVCTFSGTTITLGALVQIEANAEDATYMDSSWDQTRTMMVIAYRKASNNKMCITYFKDPASGTTGLAGTTNTEDYTCDYVTIAYDESKDVHFMVGRRTNDERGFYNTAVYNASTSKMDLSGNRDFSLAYTGSNPDHADLQGMADFQLTYMPDQQKHLFTWRGNNSGTSFSSGNRYGYYMVGEAQGTSNNTSATILFATGNAKANWTTTDYDARYARVRSFANYAIFIPHHYGATGSNKQISCRILQFAGTDASTENFIGFSDGTSYTNGQTVTVNVTGNTTTQSSLTAGEKYYIQNDGTLSTSADDPSIEAGIAVSTTQLLIKG